MLMKARAALIALLVALSVAGALPRIGQGISGPRETAPPTQKGLLRDLAEGRPEGPLDGPPGRRLWRSGRQRRQGLPARQGREGRGYPAGVRLRHRQGAVELRLRRPGELHVPRLANHADRGRRPRLHLRSAGRPVRHQHDTHKPVWHKNIWKDFGGGGSRARVPQLPPIGNAPGDARRHAPGPPGAAASAAPPAPGGRRSAGDQLPRWAITQNPLIYGDLRDRGVAGAAGDGRGLRQADR